MSNTSNYISLLLEQAKRQNQANMTNQSLSLRSAMASHPTLGGATQFAAAQGPHVQSLAAAAVLNQALLEHQRKTSLEKEVNAQRSLQDMLCLQQASRAPVPSMANDLLQLLSQQELAQNSVALASLLIPRKDQGQGLLPTQVPILPASQPSAPLQPQTSTATPLKLDDTKRILNILGTTLRSKEDPYVDVTSLDGFDMFARSPALGVVKSSSGSSNTQETFPSKLFHILCDPQYQQIVSFCPHGRSFRVLDAHNFVEIVLAKFFKQTKWSSFARQLNLWGFVRVHKDSAGGGQRGTYYYHELFLRGYPGLVTYMRRVGVPQGTTSSSSWSTKVSRVVPQKSDHPGPNLLRYPPLPPLAPAPSTSPSS